ncbi:MAG: hypothetical protein JW904_09985 [Spirochaetales bacterium]|nr:hypothetical protein [Spirochaetales bacterium]
MINLEQIRILEQKVNNAVSVIARLKEENTALRETLEKSQAKMLELETLINSFKSDQDEIEISILDVLDKLDKLEDESLEPRDAAVSNKQKSTSSLKKEPASPPVKKETTIILEDDEEESEFSSEAGNAPAAAKTHDELDIF